MEFLSNFFGDASHQAGIAAGVSTFLIQLAASKGFAIDQHTADAVSAAIVACALAVVGKHAHVEHAETHADANVTIAKLQAGEK